MARLKRRDTVDALSPNASGTASAHRSYSRVGQAAEHFVQQAGVEGPRLLQPLIGRQRHFLVAQSIAHPWHLDRNLLVGQIDRPTLGRPPHMPGQPAVAHVAFASESLDVRLQFHVYLLERHRNQRLDQRDARVEVRRRCRRHRHQPEVISFSANLSLICPVSSDQLLLENSAGSGLH